MEMLLVFLVPCIFVSGLASFMAVTQLEAVLGRYLVLTREIIGSSEYRHSERFWTLREARAKCLRFGAPASATVYIWKDGHWQELTQ